MPYDLYWDGEPEAARYYRQADQINQDRMNEQRWLQGLYVYQAIGNLQPALNPFSKGKVRDYMAKPLELRSAEKPKSKREEKKRIESGKAFMEAFAIQFNSNFRNKGGE